MNRCRAAWPTSTDEGALVLENRCGSAAHHGRRVLRSPGAAGRLRGLRGRMGSKRGAMPHVGVVGGSIGGLTAALVLRDLGCEVDVFERSGTALEARGAGIALHPMTTRYFDESSELDAAAVEIELPWADIPLRKRGAGLQRTPELPLLVLEHDLSRPRGLFRRAALSPRLRGHGLQPGRARRDRLARQRPDPDPRPARVRGRNLLCHPGKAVAGRIGPLRGLRRVAGDGTRNRS